MAQVNFDVSGIIRGIATQTQQIIANDTGKVGLSIFTLLFALHVAEGAAELAERPSSCRLFRGKFWLRVCIVGALLGGYGQAASSTVLAMQSRSMVNFAGKWAEVWGSEWNAIDQIRDRQRENKELDLAELGTSKAGKDDDTWYAKAARYVVEHGVALLGGALSMIAGGLITILILMEGFWCLGMNTLLVAIGPICIAFALHEKTEGLFWGFFRAWFVYGLLYMPMLGISCSFAGVIMARISSVAVGSGLVYGDGSNFAVHLLLVVVGPLCALAVVKAVPGFVTSLMGSMSGGGSAGGTFDMAAGMATSGASSLLTKLRPQKKDDDDDTDEKKSRGPGLGGASGGGSLFPVSQESARDIRGA